VDDADRPGADGVGDDRGEVRAHVVELLEERERSPEHAAAAGNPGRRNENEPPHEARPARGELCGDEPAERMADDVRPLQPARLQVISEPRREAAGAQAAQPGELDEVEAVARGEAVVQERPPAPGARQAVHDDQIGPLADDAVRHVAAVRS
jgi:hypothetical protein